MKRWILQVLVVVFVLASAMPNLFAQSQLVLENANRFKRDIIFSGQTIGIRLKGMDVMYKGEVRGVKPGWIYMFGDSICPDSIEKIHVEKPHFWPGLVRGASVTGMIIYPAMIVINTPKNEWSWKQPARIGGILAVGYALQRFMKIFYWRRVRLDKGRWQLKIMPRVESYF